MRIQDALDGGYGNAWSNEDDVRLSLNKSNTFSHFFAIFHAVLSKCFSIYDQLLYRISLF